MEEIKAYLRRLDRLARRADSYSRLPTLLDEFSDCAAWYHVFGRWWCVCDNFGCYLETVSDVLCAYPEYCRTMMTAAERRYYDALPNEVTVYRTQSAHHDIGLCWSLNREIALKFPTFDRYKMRSPVLLTATVARDDIAFIKLDRKEAEAVIPIEPLEYKSEILTL